MIYKRYAHVNVVKSAGTDVFIYVNRSGMNKASWWHVNIECSHVLLVEDVKEVKETGTEDHKHQPSTALTASQLRKVSKFYDNADCWR